MIKNNHSVTYISLHLVLVTKYRKCFSFVQSVIDTAVIAAKCKLEKTGISSDHVHLLIEIPSTRAIAKVVEIIKSVSSKRFMKLFPAAWPGWQTGYFVASVGRSTKSRVKKYLENQ